MFLLRDNSSHIHHPLHIRGTGTLNNGKATIHLPDYYAEIVELLGITVLITALSCKSKGMAVVHKDIDEFSVIERLDGSGFY